MGKAVEEPVGLDQVKAQVGESIECAKRMVEHTAFLLRTVGSADTAQGKPSGEELVVQPSRDPSIS